MKIHLIDGTYELFRSHFGAPPRKSPDGREVGATIGFLRSILSLLGQPGVSHVAVAFDHVIESYRNQLYAGYKTGAGVDPALLAQFPLAEQAAAALGVVVWPMVEFEADDALGAAAARFQSDARVEQILLCSPDKDLSQMVSGSRIVYLDRRREVLLDEKGVVEKFGVAPVSIPDYLALVGDSSDGYPGIPGWGPKTTAQLLSTYQHLEAIPRDPTSWGMPVNRAARLAESLFSQWEDALLYRRLATLRLDVPLPEQIDDLEWQGARPNLTDFCFSLGDESTPKRIQRWQPA